jgi:hypothetical protein
MVSQLIFSWLQRALFSNQQQFLPFLWFFYPFWPSPASFFNKQRDKKKIGPKAWADQNIAGKKKYLPKFNHKQNNQNSLKTKKIWKRIDQSMQRML